MEIIFIIMGIFSIILIYIVISLQLLKKVNTSHKMAHILKYVNDGKFNEAFNLSVAAESEEKSFYLRPVVDLDDKNIRNIIFINNVNSVILGEDQKLLFELNLISEPGRYYYFITDNYVIPGNQTIASNLVTNNFPKLFNNDISYYNILNLTHLGYDKDVKIKTDDISSLIFNGKNRELVILMSDIDQSSFYIKYKSKKEMIATIKETSLFNHIMQWGLAGFGDSRLTYVDNLVKDGENNVGAN